ncbi:MAG: hypothetical protein GY765_00830 [bacterium]|nr:hypothetical protein [bacterium]
MKYKNDVKFFTGHNVNPSGMTVILLILLIFTGTSLFSREKPKETPLMEGPYLGQKIPGKTPERFAPGIVSTAGVEHSPAVFSPDGKEVFWTAVFKGSPNGVILFSNMKNNRWSKPKPASFSGTDSDDTPAFHPNGDRLFFCSNRPLQGEGKMEPGKKKSWNIWFVDRTSTGWSKPRNAGPEITKHPNAYPCISADGTLYFVSWQSGIKNSRDIYRAKWGGKGFLKPEKLGPEINSEANEGYPYVSPDEGFIIFESDRPGGFGKMDIYISFRTKDGSPGKAQNMGTVVNTPHVDRFGWVSPDGKYLFFGSDRNGNPDVYWLPTSALPFAREMVPVE